MTTKRWALRIIGAICGFTAVIWLAAPAQAGESLAETIAYVKHEASCYALAKAAGNEHQRSRHMFNLRKHFDEHSSTIMHTIGYTEGYAEAVAYLTKQDVAELAALSHGTVCLAKV